MIRSGKICLSLLYNYLSTPKNKNEDKPRHRIHDIDETHHQVVRFAPGVSGDESVSRAEEKADRRTGQSDDERNARPEQHAVKHIASVEIGAERMLPRGRRILLGTGFAIALGKKLGPDGCGDGHENQNPKANLGRGAAEDAGE